MTPRGVPGKRERPSSALVIYLYIRRGPPMIAVRLPPDVEKRLKKLARKTGRTRTFYVREAILQHLDDLEDYYLAVQRLEENLPGVPLQEVERRLGLED